MPSTRCTQAGWCAQERTWPAKPFTCADCFRPRQGQSKATSTGACLPSKVGGRGRRHARVVEPFTVVPVDSCAAVPRRFANIWFGFAGEPHPRHAGVRVDLPNAQNLCICATCVLKSKARAAHNHCQAHGPCDNSFDFEDLSWSIEHNTCYHSSLAGILRQ